MTHAFTKRICLNAITQTNEEHQNSEVTSYTIRSGPNEQADRISGVLIT